MKKLLSFCLAGILICGATFAANDPDMQTVTSKRYVINELDKLQDKIPGTSGTKAVTLTGTRGGIEPTEVKESLGSSNSDPALPNVSAVNTGLSTKQDEIPAVNTNTVVTYTGTAGQIGQKGIYQDTGTYAAQSDNLIDAGTFNEALRTGLNNEFVCADTMPGTETCWLWTISAKQKLTLPNGYTELEYIESTGTQYINTRVSATANFDICIDGMLIRPYDGSRELFGVFPDDYSDLKVELFDNSLFASYISGSATWGGIDYGGVNNRFYICLSPHRILHSGGSKRINERPYSPTGAPVVLFGSHGVIGRIYGAEFYDGTTPTFHGIPARQDSDGKVGLYDLINERFLVNQSNGDDFIPGPEVGVYIPQGQ